MQSIPKLMTASWTQQLKDYDALISNSSTILNCVISNMTFEELLEFELGPEIPDVPEKVFKKKGIYFFELKVEELNIETTMWYTNFATLWKNGKVTWVPGIKQKRIKAHQYLSEWVPLYLGKSKNVGGRIYEHIHQMEGKTTFSMKLNARQNLHGQKFKVSWIPLEIENYDMIAPAIESTLRNIKNPIVGKQ